MELGAKYRTEDRYESPGGCSLNVSLALAKLGVHAVSYSVVGDDAYGKEIIQNLSQEGVDVRYVVQKKGMGTDVSCILVEPKSADRTIVYNRDANECLMVKKEDVLKMREIFVSGLYGNWKKNLAIIEKVAVSGSARVYYNPGQKNIAEDVERVVRLIAVSEIVFLNKDEALEIALKYTKEDEQNHRENEKYLIQKIAELGAGCVVITDGNRGAWAGNRESCYRAKAKSIKYVVDSTGAGDAFSGAFLAAYVRNKNVVECLRWGIANGSSVVQYYGASKGLLTSQDMAVASKKIEVIMV